MSEDGIGLENGMDMALFTYFDITSNTPLVSKIYAHR